MAHLHQFFSEIGNHAFGSAVELRRNTLVERCDLSDFQWSPLSDREKDAKRVQVANFACGSLAGFPSEPPTERYISCGGFAIRLCP